VGALETELVDAIPHAKLDLILVGKARPDSKPGSR
jgi:hypothetical protein